MPPLTHYTASLNAVAGILQNGFAWVPNRRKLNALLPEERWDSGREPQQFGMVSLTELEPNEAHEHRQVFGPYGITVSEEWVQKHRAQRVFYVPESGPLTRSLAAVFSLGYRDLKRHITHPDDNAQQSAFENKAMAAAIGATLWWHLLSIWEYLEPESSAYQREWRIVNPDPDYSDFGSMRQIIATVSPPLNWAKFTRVVPVAPGEVTSIVCPAREVAALRAAVPSAFREVAIVETDA